jgi:hypothetical protein
MQLRQDDGIDLGGPLGDHAPRCIVFATHLHLRVTLAVRITFEELPAMPLRLQRKFPKRWQVRWFLDSIVDR